MSVTPLPHAFSRLEALRVVPVVAVPDADRALMLAETLMEAGHPILEITFRNKEAGEALRSVRGQFPQMLLGAGTLTTLEDVAVAADAGADFGVAPGTNPAIIEEASRRGLPFIPGVCTPSEIETAMAAGAMLLKFFPAELMGGVAKLRALHAPYKHRGLRVMPTNGITPANADSYLNLEFVVAIGGSWIAPPDAIESGEWSRIANNARELQRFTTR